MDAKIKKEFSLTVGTNDEGFTDADLIAKVNQLEVFGNTNLGVRFHIFENDEGANLFRETTLFSAMEFGFKGHESGHNLEKVRSDLSKLLEGKKDGN